MRPLINQKFRSQVAKEAYNLKQHASPDELSRLDVETLDGEHSANCIYGKMTGSCFSERAAELLSLCARAFSIEVGDEGPLIPIARDDIFERATGLDDDDTMYCFSPIEVFLIRTKDEAFKYLRVNLVDFLQGRVNELII